MDVMNQSASNPTRIAVLHYFGDLAYWKLPDIAVEALEAGYDGIALRKVAGFTDVLAGDLTPNDIDCAFREMGVESPISKDAARLALAAEAARKALSGKSNVFDVATHIRIHLCELADPPPELRQIVSLAQQCQRNAKRTSEDIERELRTAMSQFLKDHGNVIDISL